MSGIKHESAQEPIEAVKSKVEDIKTKYGLTEPDRGNLDNPDIEWRTGKPDYSRANYQYLTGKTQNHAAGKPRMCLMWPVFQTFYS